MFIEIVVHIFISDGFATIYRFSFKNKTEKNTGNNKEVIRKIKLFSTKMKKLILNALKTLRVLLCNHVNTS